MPSLATDRHSRRDALANLTRALNQLVSERRILPVDTAPLMETGGRIEVVSRWGRFGIRASLQEKYGGAGAFDLGYVPVSGPEDPEHPDPDRSAAWDESGEERVMRDIDQASPPGISIWLRHALMRHAVLARFRHQLLDLSLWRSCTEAQAWALIGLGVERFLKHVPMGDPLAERMEALTVGLDRRSKELAGRGAGSDENPYERMLAAIRSRR